MKNTLAALACLAALSLSLAPARADEYAYHRVMDAESSAAGAAGLTVSGYNGDVRLVADGGTAVRVHAVLKARSADAVSALNVSVSRSGNTVRVQDVCPSQRQLLFWTFADCDIDLEIHYPRGLTVTLHHQNGDIAVHGATKRLSITNGNGDIAIDGAAANVSVSESNGDVTTHLAKDWRGSAVSLHTNQGDLELFVPPTFAATYTTHVLLGSIRNRAPRQSGAATVTATVRFGDIDIRTE